MVKYECARCGKEAEYDPAKDAVKIKARTESEQFGRDVFYDAVRCPHCGMRNELRSPEDKSAPHKFSSAAPAGQPGAAPPPAGTAPPPAAQKPAQTSPPGQKPTK
jgi:DNA-directed RNA polymerase subunit RPC12/RpoP